MILPLRRRHPRLIAAVGLAGGALLVAALTARPAPRRERLPAGLAAAEPSEPVRAGGWVDLAPGELRLRRLAAADGDWIEIAPAAPRPRAATHLYLVAGESTGGAALPAGAGTLGAFAGDRAQRYPLPSPPERATIVLYDLAAGATVALAPLPPSPTGG